MPSTRPEAAADAELTRALSACLPAGRFAGPLVAMRAVGSTQDVARQWASAGAPEGAVVVAEYQSAGRGRRGRAWTAPPGTALLCSIVLRPALPVGRWPEIPIVAGCAVAEGIEAASGVATALEWPNDVLAGGRKVAGILVEGVAGGAPVVVLGIGVNVAQDAGDFPGELARRATSLALLGATVSRVALLGAILARLSAWYDTLQAAGFEPVRAGWRRRGRLGGAVRGHPGAVALDLAPGGGLVVRQPDGATTVVTTLAPEAPAIAVPA